MLLFKNCGLQSVKLPSIPVKSLSKKRNLMQTKYMRKKRFKEFARFKASTSLKVFAKICVYLAFVDISSERFHCWLLLPTTYKQDAIYQCRD